MYGAVDEGHITYTAFTAARYTGNARVVITG
jgi:hypothetical protein